MAVNSTIAHATSVFTVTDNFDDTETCVIGGKTYTVNATVGTSDGSVDLGTDAEGTLQNLAAAINLDPTGGETGVADADYASGMTIHPDVICTGSTATTLTIKAKTPGTVGNFINTSDTHGEGSWTSTVMANGAGNMEDWLTSLFSLSQINSEVLADLKTLTPEAD